MRSLYRYVIILLALALSLSAAPAVVQVKSVVSTTGSVTVPLTNAVTAGNTLAVFITADTGQGITVSDSATNTYSEAGTGYNGPDGSYGGLAVFYASNVAAGSDTVTVTRSGSSFMQAHVVEISGLVTSSPLDTFGTGFATAGTGISVTTSGAVSQTGDFVLAVFNDWSAYQTWVAGSGFTLVSALPGGSDNESVVESMNTNPSSGSVTATITKSASTSNGLGFIVAFKASSGTGIPTVISGINAAPSATGASVTWTTDEPASSRVDYGLTTSYGSNVVDASNVTSHNLSISGLTCNTTYNYQVSSTNASAQTTTSPNQTFTTTACGQGAATTTPSLYFTDILSGPNTGGESSGGYAGAYVTIYGNFFGASQGTSTITMNGSACMRVVSWGSTWLAYQKIVVQLGPSCASGNIVVTTSKGASNALPFTVRSGNIYFVSTIGNDSTGNGSFASPWATVVKAKNSVLPGDIAYIENGVSQTAVDDYSAAFAVVGGNATAQNPIAILAYPGATATLGTVSLSYAVRTPAVAGSKSFWVFGGLHLVGLDGMDLVGVDGWRVIGNDFTCPQGSGQSACFHSDSTTNLKFIGNYVHNVGDQAGSIDKFYHAVYFTTNSNSTEAAWNTIVPNPGGSTTSGGCRAMQFYSTGGADEFDEHVHDNIIHDAICDGINFATVDPSKGTVEAYNNIVYHVGTGPDPTNGASNYSCLLAGSSSGSTTPVEIYNNTFYDCGARKTGDAGAVAAAMPVHLRNNLVMQLSGEAYLNPNIAGCVGVTGNNNLWYGVGTRPCALTNDLNVNPLLVSPTSDFHLQSSSPAKDAGVTISSLTQDYEGNIRPQGSAYDIGAYEYASSGGAPSGVPTITTKGSIIFKGVVIIP